MFTHRANGFAHAGERHRTSYPTNIPSLSAQSPMEQSGSAVQTRIYNANPPNGCHSSPGQADQCLIGYPTHPGYATRQNYLSRHNGQSYRQVSEPDEGGWPLHRRSLNAALGNASRHVPALPVSNSGGALAQFEQPVYEGRSAGRAVPNNDPGIYDGFSSPLGSPSRNLGLESLEIQGISL